MRRRDFIIGSGMTLLSGLNVHPMAALASPNGLTGQAGLGAELIARLQAARPRGDNIVVSPASVTSILLVLAQGADEKMKAAIHQALGFDPQSSQVAADLETARSVLAGAGSQGTDGQAEFRLANMLVIDPRSRPNAPVVERIRENAEVVLDELSKIATVNRINDWVAARTNGHIRKMLDAPQSNSGLVGLNALYFNAMWREHFDLNLTRLESFTPFSGKAVTVPMMTRIREGRARAAGRFVAVDLPYKSDRFGMVVITTNDKPAAASEFSTVRGWMTGEMFASQNVDLSLPRFTLTEGADLLGALGTMGLHAGRTSPTAFAPLLGARQDLSSIAQRVYLRVDENGTEAAASTAITLSRSAVHTRTLRVAVDKPFMFALRDRKNGLTLLMGYVGRLPDQNTLAER